MLLNNKLSLLIAASISALAINPIVAEAATAATATTNAPKTVNNGLSPQLTSPAPISAKEKADGDKAHPEIMKEFGGAYQSTQTAYVVRVGKKIAVQSGLGNAESAFNVTLLNSSVNNAFAIPGGYVYITRELVGLCNSEAEMAGVLGHEVGHVAARHSAKRNDRATIANILGTLGTIGGALLGNSGGLLGMLGGVAKQYSGTLAQIFTLSYSRGQEEQADDLGIYYLSKAGYDPTALSDMLNSLAMESAVEAKVAGQGDRQIPEWASTHPDPAKRVVRAATNAKVYAANTYRNADGHFAAINNMMYDDDPHQGVVDGQNFIFPDNRFKFSAPTGFGLQNGADKVTINGTSGQAIFAGAAFNGDRQAYVAAALKSVVGDQQTLTPGAITQTTVNGIPAFTASATATTQSGQVEVTVFAYEFGTNQAYHFVTVSPINTNPFTAMYQSMVRMTATEAASIKPRKLKIITVAKGDSIATLSAKMAYSNLQSERFLALNGIKAGAMPAVGSKVKIVTY